jgi:uncharacterized circularly permuted ATP-grasp superfamily protein
VALKKGSYVVNSSQGGGSKDTWVLGDDLPPDLAAVDPRSHAVNGTEAPSC